MRLGRSIGFIALGAAIALACGDDDVILQPTEVSPPGDTGVGTDVATDGQGAFLLASVRVTGTTADVDGYVVLVVRDGGGDPYERAVEAAGGDVLLSDLPAGTYTVSLESVGGGCRLWGQNERAVEIEDDLSIPRTWFAVDCPRAGRVFEREPLNGWRARYVLQQDSAFRDELFHPQFGLYGYGAAAGEYSVSAGAGLNAVQFFFDYGAFGIGVTHGDCMSVRLDNPGDIIDPLEEGEFCLSSGPVGVTRSAPTGSTAGPTPLP